MSCRQRVHRPTHDRRNGPGESPNRRGEVGTHPDRYYENQTLLGADLAQLRQLLPDILPPLHVNPNLWRHLLPLELLSQWMQAQSELRPNWTMPVPSCGSPNQGMPPDLLLNLALLAQKYWSPNQGTSHNLNSSLVRVAQGQRNPNQEIPPDLRFNMAWMAPRYGSHNQGIPPNLLSNLARLEPGYTSPSQEISPDLHFNMAWMAPRYGSPNQGIPPNLLSNLLCLRPGHGNPNQGVQPDFRFNMCRPVPRYRSPDQRMPRDLHSNVVRPVPRYRHPHHQFTPNSDSIWLNTRHRDRNWRGSVSHRDYDRVTPRQNHRYLNRDREAAPPTASPIQLPLHEDFVKLDRERVLDIIQRDNLNASPQEICEAVLKWVEEDDSRSEHLHELMLEVRLIFLPHELLLGLVNNPLVRRVNSCLQNVFSALTYRRLFPLQRAYVWRNNRLPDNYPGKHAAVFKGRFCKQRTYSPAKRLYIFGSTENIGSDIIASSVTSVEFCDFQSGRWTVVEDMPCSRQGFAAAAFNDNIWIVGGVCDGQGIVSTVDIYNPASNAWTTGPPTMEKRSSLGLVAYNGSLYAIGGRTETRDSNKSTEVIGHDSQSWSEGVPMNVFRADMGSVVLGSRIYVIGGVQPENSMEYFCSKINQWTLLSKKRLFNRDCRGIAVDDELLYIIGGDREKNCHIFNPAVNHKRGWQLLPKVDKRCINRFSTVAAVDGFIYVIGGLIGNQRMATVGQYDPANCKWKLTSHCKSARAGAKAVVVNAP